MSGSTKLSTCVVSASTKATIPTGTNVDQPNDPLNKPDFSSSQMKANCDRTEATVPSKLLSESGNLVLPNLEPMIEAKESPMPIERTPLRRAS